MNSIPAIWVDGERAAALPLPDRGLDFGDGLFETFLLWRGRPLFPELHFQRLERGLGRLCFPDCLALSRERVFAAAGDLPDWEWAALRLTVTRGSAPRGYAPPPAAVPRHVVTAAPLDQDRCRQATPITLFESAVRWSHQPLLAGLKHLNRLEQVLAAAEAGAAGCDEALMLDTAGNVCSTSSANLFIVEGERLVTPVLENSGIAGTRRQLVCQHLASAAGLEVAEQAFAMPRLLAADEVFCTNSLRGVQAVERIGDKTWTNHPVSAALHDLLVEAMSC